MQSTSPAAAGAARHAGRALMPARLFDGALARATDGYTLGFVSEVVLDLRTGRVAYALLALDERVHARLLTAVPWHYVALDADGTGAAHRAVGGHRARRASDRSRQLAGGDRSGLGKRRDPALRHSGRSTRVQPRRGTRPALAGAAARPGLTGPPPFAAERRCLAWL
ncbi:PRC-barrel domain-containing protein [Burkholderia glumae]|uniref:PRC-barrel domain-containing protein n=1 Tax=Burkholderia glumae TaxID=337 RepID=UPI001320138C|nr:PRC-barrel domain-containing protein [Burkholderia glumae]QHE12132.1 hypothetical protein GQR88_17050 [Burkholderia glumae AU6208]